MFASFIYSRILYFCRKKLFFSVLYISWRCKVLTSCTLLRYIKIEHMLKEWNFEFIYSISIVSIWKMHRETNFLKCRQNSVNLPILINNTKKKLSLDVTIKRSNKNSGQFSSNNEEDFATLLISLSGTYFLWEPLG